jgi:hypothetical protein
MLSFAFRDMSFLLVLQLLFSAVLIPLATYLITRHYYPLPNLVLVTEDEVTGSSPVVPTTLNPFKLTLSGYHCFLAR